MASLTSSMPSLVFSLFLLVLLVLSHGARAATVMDVINGEARLSTLSAALTASGLDSTLRGAGTF